MIIGFALVAVFCSGLGCEPESAVSQTIFPEYSDCMLMAKKSDYPAVEGETLQCLEVYRYDQ